MKLIIVTGLSGSGKTVALHALEDAGHYCIDNLPISLLDALSKELLDFPQRYKQDVAIGIDVRTAVPELHSLPRHIEQLRNLGFECRVLFLDARDATLLQRFSETRRRHPLADHHQTLTGALLAERELLQPVRLCADIMVDTTRLNLHELRKQILLKLFQQAENMQIQLLSFGFKYGTPQDADMMFDARFLPNPYWQPGLRKLTGKNEAVEDFLSQTEQANTFKKQISTLLLSLIPGFQHEGRAYLTVAIGCTGGQHRSVYLVEQIAQQLHKEGYNSVITHRELG